jgi:hypothetical protein
MCEAEWLRCLGLVREQRAVVRTVSGTVGKQFLTNLAFEYVDAERRSIAATEFQVVGI